MIRTVKDVTALLDRRAGAAGRSPMSLLRIGVWLVIGLFLTSFVVHAQKPLGSRQYQAHIKVANVRDVTLDHNDPRGFFHVDQDPRYFRIAWIGASTLQNIAKHKHYTFVPADFRAAVPEIGGKPVRVDMYFVSGARIQDMYNAVLAAIHGKPNLIVVDDNPLYAFNTLALQSWPSLNEATAPYALARLGSWPLLASFATPEDLALGLADRRLAPLRERWSLAQKINDRLDNMSPLKQPTPTTPPTHLSALQQIQAMGEALDFWLTYRPIDNPHDPVAARQLALLNESNIGGGTVPDRIVGQLLGALAASKIPAYFYFSDVDPHALSDPDVNAALARIEGHMHDLADRHRAATLDVQWQSLERVVPPVEFNDIVHIADDGPIVAYLARTLCAQLARLNPKTTCSRIPGGSP